MAAVTTNGTNGHTNGTNGHTNGTNGHTNGFTNGDVHMNGHNEQEDEDGYFTCAVSVQHKRVDSEAGSHYSEDSLGRKVVWPAEGGTRVTTKEQQAQQHHATFASTFKGVGGKTQQDQPHKWPKQTMEMTGEDQGAWEVKQGQGSNRIARSRSRSKNIMERARSFERAAEEVVSRPGSRAGSGYRHRSPSLGNKSGQGDESWINLHERPASRTDVDTRRFADIGRVNTMDWEQKINGSSENIVVGRTPPPKRRELKAPCTPQMTKRDIAHATCGTIEKGSWPPVQMEDERVLATKTPEPPPPPTRCTYPPNSLKEHSPPFPRPPSEATNKLSEETVLQLEEEHKQDIVKQWVESTAQNAEDMAKELEKFAYDIAETVVNNMEKKSEKKDSTTTTTASMAMSSSSSVTHQNQASRTEQTSQSSSSGMHMNSAGTFHAMPVQTTPKNLHGPIYVQEQNARVGMTFQQEDRRREELRKQEEAKQEERRKREQAALEQQQLYEEQQRLEQQRQLAEMEKQRQEQLRLQEEERRKKEEEMRRIEEEKRKQDELKRQEMMRLQEEQRRQQEEERRRNEEEMKRQEMLKIQEEQRRQQEEERKRKEEELKRQEMLKFQEEQRRQQEEERKRKEEELNRKIEEEKLRMEQLKKQEEELKYQEMLRMEKAKQEQEEMRRQELMRYEMLKQEEEAKRLEEIRLQQEIMRQYELQQQMEKQKLIEAKKAEQLLIDQEEAKRRNRVPKTITKAASFDQSQENQTTNVRSNRNVSTGYVNEKRNFWMRSTSADHGLNRVDLSPAPRRRRMDSWNRRDERENEDPESRPGSSLGHGAQTGSVRSLSTGFLAKSKSSAAVMDETVERGRPKRRNFRDGYNWSKEKYDQQVNQSFVKTHEVKTNKVHDTINTWGPKDVSNSGRTTPVPSRGIGEVFAENKVAKNTSELQSNAWRTKTPEPSVKLVNVVVEKAVGSNQNIQISENAEAQLAKFFSESKQVQSFSSSTNESSFTSMSQQSNQKQEVIQNGMSKVKTSEAGPPPAPERNQSIGVAERYLSQ